MNIREAEALATVILNAVDKVLCIKLRDLKPQLEKLRLHFKELKKSGGRIAGCTTWDEFCREKLHRTRRAVNALLSESAQQQMDWEKTSHLEVPQRKAMSSQDQGKSPSQECEREQEHTRQPKGRADSLERLIDDVDAENLRDATRRTLACFKPLTDHPDRLWSRFTEWFDAVASQLGLSATVIKRNAPGDSAGEIQQANAQEHRTKVA
jgi:hypothetical protein